MRGSPFATLPKKWLDLPKGWNQGHTIRVNKKRNSITKELKASCPPTVPNLFLCLSDGFPEEIAFKTRGADESFKDNGPYEFETEELLTERRVSRGRDSFFSLIDGLSSVYSWVRSGCQAYDSKIYMSTPMKLVWKRRQRKKLLSIRSSKKCSTDKVKRESSLRRPSSIRLT